ncbi:MAG: glycosyltransferase [Bacteroidales bacterium]|jgi:glycosyltransferase involved in cell wall biosynthesis|nr:glycosyltransferase [Bacteroidales bacterium]
MEKICVSVTNDLITDQRVHKICTTLLYSGLDVILIGRRISGKKHLDREYKTYRMKLLFKKSAMFYAEYNLRLFFFLLFMRTNMLLANDTDTLLANFLVSKIKRKRLIFDAHELFPEVPEIINKPFVKKFWTKIEDFIFPKLRNSYTVCQSVSDYYKKKYNINMQVVRNIPFEYFVAQKQMIEKNGKKVILYQGAVNVGRGLECVIDAMQYLENCIFYIIGDGDILETLRQKVQRSSLENKVIFTGRVSFDLLSSYTVCADLGVNLLENKGLNYYFSLPNRIFDYIRSEVPVLSVDFPEIRRIIEKYGVGKLVSNFNPVHLANVIKEMLAEEKNITGFSLANRELTWENEIKQLMPLFSNCEIKK